MKTNKAIYWVLAVVIAAIGIFIYLFLGDTPKTLSKISLSYFSDEQQIVDSVSKRLFQEINGNKFYWIGIEPQKKEQLPILILLADSLNTKYGFKKIIVDQELELDETIIKALHTTDIISIKNDLFKVADLIAELEKTEQSYLLVTASIYSTSLLPQNPIFKIKESKQIKPLTVSFAYFAVDTEDENKMTFPCSTDDRDGTSKWGCVVVNKTRTIRRKIDKNNNKPWLGILDQSSEKDYVLIVKKRIF